MSNIYLKKEPAVIEGAVRLPGSKSLTNRALIIEAIANQGSFVQNKSKAQDSVLMEQLLGSQDAKLDCEMAGTTLRFLMAHFAAKAGKEVILTGSDRLKVRPVKALVEALKDLGAEIEYAGNPGFPPVKIMGQALEGGRVKISGRISSQFISALAMVAPNFKKGLIIDIDGDLVSAPYLHMTVDLMKYFDADIEFTGQQLIIKNKIYIMKPYRVEPDWSAASYWYAFMALSSEGSVRLNSLKLESSQGDSICAELFKDFGVKSSATKTGVVIEKDASIEKSADVEMDLVNYPDLAPTVAVVLAAKKKRAKLTGLQTLQLKETERLTALKTELEKFNVSVKIEDRKTLIIDASNFEAKEDVLIETYNDHRMAMAFAPLVMVNNSIKIADKDVVKKSYPNFWDELNKLSGISLK